jgi:hypothetical protein
MFGRYRKTAPRTGVRIGPPHSAVKLGTGSAVRSHRRHWRAMHLLDPMRDVSRQAWPRSGFAGAAH